MGKRPKPSGVFARFKLTELAGELLAPDGENSKNSKTMSRKSVNLVSGNKMFGTNPHRSVIIEP
jgi:hypothetical protein